MNPREYDERIWIHERQYLQLAICRTHTCLSRGYNRRSIGQARVREILEKEKRFSIICICPGSRWKSGWGYYWEEYLPYTVENIAVGINPDIDIWNNYLVLLRLLLISKEGVRHPNFGRVRESEIVEFAWDTNSCQHKLSLRNAEHWMVNGYMHIHQIYHSRDQIVKCRMETIHLIGGKSLLSDKYEI